MVYTVQPRVTSSALGIKVLDSPTAIRHFSQCPLGPCASAEQFTDEIGWDFEGVPSSRRKHSGMQASHAIIGKLTKRPLHLYPGRLL